MTFLHPANLDAVVDRVAHDLAAAHVASATLVNVGPGNALSPAVARSLDATVELVDGSAAPATTDVPSRPQPSEQRAQPRDAIAIVGMAVQFPGAKDASELWLVLEKGLNTVAEIPEARFGVSEYVSRTGASTRSLKTRFGNFVDNVDAFDNAFFRISPREARSMDPQQRLLLQVTYHALENAGYVPGATETFNPDTFATYVGVSTNDYLQNLRNDVDVYYSTGTLQAFLSGKISYAFKFSGPSVVVDTACSSSMVAIYQACRALNNKDCNAAVAGGVNVIASPDMYIGLDRAHFLSSAGQCKPWDASADGYSRSEGCGMFVLKRLSDAVAEGDHILGVVRGIEVNQSANAASITQPHVPSQVSLFERLASSAGVAPADVSVVEAHGTGTKAGDPAELESIRTVFARDRTPDNPLHVTSIKANIGHAEAASGAASLAKLLLMLKHRAIPAVISLKQLNPRIPALSLDGTRIDTKFTHWDTAEGGPRRRLALMNNFGAAGSNAALILEEPAAAPPAAVRDPATAFLVGVSAESEDALETLRTAFVQHIDGAGDGVASLGDLSYTATARRQLHAYRIAVSGQTKADLARALASAQVVRVNEARGRTVFVFSGQGGQYVGMGAHLYDTAPVFRQAVDACDAKLVSWGFSGVLHVVASGGAADQERDIEAFQAAVFVLEYALWSLWTSWGVVPDAVAGHSLGEYAALVAAEVLSLDDALRLVAGRARLMARKCVARHSGMLAVKATSSAVARLITRRDEFDELAIACYNSSVDCVVAGSLRQLEALQKELKDAGTICVSLSVPFAYHTNAMAPIFGDIKDLARDVPLSAPTIPVLSNVHGSVVAAGNASVFNPEYFARHCQDPVRFEQGIRDLLSDPDFCAVTTWIEIGPHPTTLPMLRSMPSTSQQATYLPSLRKSADDWATLSASLATLYCTRNDIQWRRVLSDLCPGASLTELPAYPFAQTKYWVAFREDAQSHATGGIVAPASRKFSLIDSCVRMPPAGSNGPAVFQTSISTVARLIDGHKVSGFGLCPASVYVEMAMAAAQLVLEDKNAASAGSLVKLGDINFPNPLVYSPETPRTIRIEISFSAPGDLRAGRFEISSYPDGQDGKSQVHCRGAFATGSSSSSSSKLALSGTMLQQRRKSVVNNPESETMHTRTAYGIVFSRVVAYSPLYHTMTTITVNSDGNDAYAVVQLPAEAIAGDYVVNPIFMDTLLHAAGFLVNLNATSSEAFICVQVDRINVVSELIDCDAAYGVYCSIGILTDAMAVADAYAVELGQGTVVAHLKRLHFRRLKTAGFKRLLSSAVSVAATPPAASGVVTPSSVESSATLLENDAAADLPAASTLMEKLKETMGSVLDLSPALLGDDEELERLGMDSLTSIEAHHALCSSLNFSLPDNLFATAKSIRELFDVISQRATSHVLRAEINATLFAKQLTPPQSSAPAYPPAPAAGSAVKTIMASVLDIPVHELHDDADLERLGLDSLMSIEAHHALCAALQKDLPADILLTCKTVRNLQALVTPPSASPQVTSPGTPSTEKNPLPIQDAECEGTPLFLIHDGGGLVGQYKKLGALGCPVYGIQNPKFAAGGKWEGGIVEMAAHYVGLIQPELRGRTRCVLGGWSVGGVLAYEISRQLISLGTVVSGLILIDSPCPQTVSALPDSVVDSVFAAKRQGSHKLRGLVRENIKSLTRSLVNYDYTASPASHIRGPRAVMLACTEGVNMPNGESASTRWLADRRDLSRMVAEWENVLQANVPVFDIPGSHFEVFEPHNIDAVTLKLREALATLT